MDIGALFREYAALERRRGDGLDPQELERWAALKQRLSEHFSPGRPKDAKEERRSIRVPTRLQVSFPTDGELARSLMTNLSRHGVFVRTAQPLELGTRFELRIQVERPPREIVVPVEVVTVGLGPYCSANLQGMGLGFLAMDPATAKQIDELYELSVE